MGTYLLVGEVLGVTEETREYNGESWIETKIHVLEVGGVRTNQAVVAKDFPKSEQPNKGDVVALEVSIRPWVSKKGNAGIGVTAWRRVPAIERVLKSTPQPVAAAS